MPLEQRVIAPIFVSRGCFTLDAHHPNGQITSSVNIPNELECVTNGTLANIIRQLSSLSRYAEDLFGSILEETSTLVQRSVSLKSRLDVLSERVERLDASSDSASLQSASSAGANLSKKPFRSRADNFDQQVVARGTIPLSLREVYEGCDEPPPLEKLNPFRDDNINGLKLYTNPNYFFELWRKEMLADRSRNKVAKKGETAHNSAKSKRNKASVLRHQTSINSDSTASPAHYQQHQQQQQQVHQQAGQHAHYHPASVAYGGSLSSNEYPPTYSETGTPTYGHLAAAAHQQQQAQQQAYAQQQAQQKIYGQTGPNGPVYGYMGGPGGDVVSVKREEPNASGVGTYTVIEGYSVDPNNYQHHYVQYAGGQQGPPGSASNRPNSLELSHQQQYGTYGTTGGTGGQPMPPPMEQYHGYTQQQQQQQQQQYQRSQGPYGQTGVQQQSIYGQTTGGPQQQQQPSQYSPGSAANTPTRRAGASRPSAPPPAPPSNPNSAPSTPKKVNGVFDMSVVSGHSPLVSRDSLPPPPPPPPGHANGGGGGPGGLHHLNSQDSIDSVLPPPPPPPPLPGAAGMVNGTSAAFSPPPPPPPPPMNLNGLSMHSSSSTTNTTTSRQTTSAMPTSVSNSNSVCPNPTAEMLKNQAVKLRPTQANNHRDSGPVSNSSTLDPHSNLMAAIRDGFKLKKVEESAAKEKERTVPLHDVASILARRVAMELSDSEAENEDADEDSDAWDDESEC